MIICIYIVHRHVKPSINVSKHYTKFVMLSIKYHNITRLLLVAIIISSKKYMIFIIGKENILINLGTTGKLPIFIVKKLKNAL